MIHEPEIRAAAPADEWAIRSEFWIAENAKSERKRRRRERNSNSLILTGHGTSLRIENGALIITQGFSHFPQKQESHRYFKGDLALPRIVILLDGSGYLSFDVLNWLGEQGVALARITWDGDLAVMASGAGFIANPEKVRWQFDMRQDEQKRLGFARDLVRRKLENSIDMLVSQLKASAVRDQAIATATKGIEWMQRGSFNAMIDVRSIEGECAASYFAAWSEIEMQWIAQSRYPVPDEWRTYQSRSSILTGRKAKNWKASHPINAMLNYAYAVKATQLQVQAVAEGFDAYSGIMHHSRPDFPAYVYDLIEPERPKVDSLVIGFVQSRKFSGADFVVRKDCACRLSPQLAPMVAGLILCPRSETVLARFEVHRASC
jgi:CRISPR-associated endonuclease Cas1